MTAILSFGVEYGLAVKKDYKPQTLTIAASSGAASAPVHLEGRQYEVTTVPIRDSAAIALDEQLRLLNGGLFLSQFFMDRQPYYYRLEPSSWEWKSIGPDSNTISFSVRRYFPDVYEVEVQATTTLRVKRAGFGDGYEQVTMDGINAKSRAYDITSIPLTDNHAQALDAALSSLNGSYFWSRLGGDTEPRKYRLDPFQWQSSFDGPNRTTFSFKVKEAFDP